MSPADKTAALALLRKHYAKKDIINGGSYEDLLCVVEAINDLDPYSSMSNRAFWTGTWTSYPQLSLPAALAIRKALEMQRIKRAQAQAAINATVTVATAINIEQEKGK